MARTRGSDEYEAILEFIPSDFSNPADSLEEIRAKFDLVHGQPVGDGVLVEEHPLGLWVRPQADHDDRVVLFAHSGGFVTSTAAMCAFWAAVVARECGLGVFVVEYSLAPETVFPTQLDELVAAHEMLLADGHDPTRTLFMGDSCGGGMALATMVRQRESGRPLPAAFVGFGGWYDLLAEDVSAVDNEDPFVDPDWMRLRARDYVGPDGDPAHPHASVVNADLAGLPPMLLQTGEVDPCLPGARLLAARADAPVTIDVVLAVAQGFQGMGTHIPEVAAAWATVRAWVDERVPPA
ncbi:MAG: alpha/beta hydrolase fold domain-containing protein [Actinomycetota bacterium]